MRPVYLIHFGTFATRSLLGLVASCGFTLMLSTVAMAASNDQDNNAQKNAVLGSVDANSANANATEKDLSTSSDSASSVAVIKDNSVQSKSAVSEGSVASLTLTDNNGVVAANKDVTKDALNTPVVAQNVAKSDVTTAPAEPSKPKAANGETASNSVVAEVQSQLTPSASGWVMIVSGSQQTMVAQPEITHAIALAAAALPPVNAPVEPKGLLGQWTRELMGVTLPIIVSGLITSYVGFQFFAGWLVLTLVMMGIVGISYGAWLRRVGHVTAARSNLISYFATPSFMDFLLVVPPERSPFFMVSDTNNYIFKDPQKGASL